MTKKKRSKKSIRRPIQERSQMTVDSILGATTQILNQESLENVSTNKIAQRAGVGIGSLYQYFRNKDEIIQALVSRLLNQKLKLIEKELGRLESSSLDQAIENVIRSLVISKKKSSRLERAIEERFLRIGSLETIKEHDSQVRELLMRYFEPFQNDLRQENFEATLFIITHSVRAVIVGANLFQESWLKEEVLISELVLMTKNYLKKM